VGFVSTPLLDNYVYNVVYISLFIVVQYVLPTLSLLYLNFPLHIDLFCARWNVQP